MSNTIKVTDKPIATNVSSDATLLGIQDNALYQMPVADITVGRADNLKSNVGVDDHSPYLFRTTGGSADVGSEKSMEIVGGTIGWNQLCDATQTLTVTGLTITNPKTGTYRVNGTLDAAKAQSFGVTMQKGHVYLLDIGRPDTDYVVFTNAQTWATSYKTYLVKPTEDNKQIFYYFRATTFTDVDFTPLGIDLTQMFGSTIADYIYSLETSNAGDGVAWFKRLFPADYYAYDAGTLMSVKTSAHKMTGFNQWDEEWEVGDISSGGVPISASDRIRAKNFIPVLPNTTYYVNSPTNVRVITYDGEQNFVEYFYSGIKNTTFTIASNVHFIKFYTFPAYGTTYNHDICINFHWDGSRDGEYEPYVKHEYPIDDVELHGIPYKDAADNVRYDGDVYHSDGTVERKYAKVSLGSLTWTYNSTYSCWQTSGLANLVKKYVAQADMVKNKAEKYIVDEVGTLNGANFTDGKYIVGTSGNMFVKNGSTETKPSGDFVYELATPTTETADPFAEHILIDDFGTEEFVDTRTVPVPVGTNSVYVVDLKAKLEMAPNSPDGNGDYIVRQTDGTNHYVQLTFPADELPAAPTTDGNYVLKCTVASGEASYTWAAE